MLDWIIITLTLKYIKIVFVFCFFLLLIFCFCFCFYFCFCFSLEFKQKAIKSNLRLDSPVGLGCRIYRLRLCRGITQVSWIWYYTASDDVKFLFVCILWHINLCWLSNAKSIIYNPTVLLPTIQFSISTQFNCQKHFYFKLFSLVKQF